MNTGASPAPRRKRAPRASAKLSVKAIAACPTAISSEPATKTRIGPKRSSRCPAGICIAAYTATCVTDRSARPVACVSNRSSASTPATPSAVRCTSATKYTKRAAAKTATADLRARRGG